jgi:hypothetical protein
MISSLGGRWLVTLAVLAGSAGGAAAGDVEIAPFAGLQFGGSIDSVATGQTSSIGAGLDLGATLDVSISESWRVELLYSRQETQLSGGGAPRLDLKLERYMVGIQEEKGERRARFFGIFLLGLTRFAPGLGYDSSERFTGCLGLGIKSHLSKHFGLRAEARGFFVAVETGGGTVCSGGTCLFAYHTAGIWQGDVSAGVVMSF